jgi:hypothetical protein
MVDSSWPEGAVAVAVAVAVAAAVAAAAAVVVALTVAAFGKIGLRRIKYGLITPGR